MHRLLVAALLVAAPAAQGGPPALATVAEDLAHAVGAPADGRRALALSVEVRAPGLAAPLEAAVEAALAGRGYAVTPARGPDREAAARAAGQDWLLRIQGGLVPGRRELAVVGELIPAWPSFFLQRRPAARAVPQRVVSARAPADPETLLLAREGRAPGAPFARVRALARVPGRLVALAAGEVEPGVAGIVAADERTVLLLSPAGAVLARRDAEPGERAPIRDPGAALAVGDLGGGRIGVHLAGARAGEVLERRGERLVPVAPLAAAPLCATEALRLFGAFAPGSGVLLDQLTPAIAPDARPRSPRELYGVACAPRGGPIAIAVLGTDLGLELLDAELRTVAAWPGVGQCGSRASTSSPPHPDPLPLLRGGRGSSVGSTSTSTSTPSRLPALPHVGSALALADLDGDGTAELVATEPTPRAPDRLRVLAPLAPAPLLLEAPVEGLVVAAAAGDLTGDGVDDAVLGAVVRGEDGAEATDLLLVTADPREGP